MHKFLIIITNIALSHIQVNCRTWGVLISSNNSLYKLIWSISSCIMSVITSRTISAMSISSLPPVFGMFKQLICPTFWLCNSKWTLCFHVHFPENIQLVISVKPYLVIDILWCPSYTFLVVFFLRIQSYMCLWLSLLQHCCAHNKYALQDMAEKNGTRCRHGGNVAWCHSYINNSGLLA